MKTEEAHKHAYDLPVDKKFLLYRWAREEGSMRIQDVSGFDILKGMECECGNSFFYNVERTKI